jgi:hypothetical protein
MTLKMTLSQGPLENLDGLTLLRRADMAVDLHRRLARRVTQQLLSDARMEPAPTSRLAAPWRRSCSRILGSPARRRRAWKCLVSHDPLTG